MVCLSALVIAALSACAGTAQNDGVPAGGGYPGGGNPGDGQMMGGNRQGGAATSTPGDGSGNTNGRGPGDGAGASGSYSSAGERIWLTGVGVDDRLIRRTAPPIAEGSLMMGGGGCGSCHAQDGRGGTIRMMMGPAIEAPDVTYSALIKEGFTDATIARAIRDGLHERGEPLDTAMPRWQMSNADVDATIAYLKVLDKR